MAWNCQHCHIEVEDDSFEICWNCQAMKGQSKPIAQAKSLACLRCKTPLSFVGSKEFHEGMRWGALGNLAEMFVSKEPMDMFACKDCGKVEFFLSGFNEHYKGQNS